MATKKGTTTSSIMNRENKQKVQVVKPLLTKRAAFGEIGNKINNTHNQTGSFGVKGDCVKKTVKVTLEKKETVVITKDRDLKGVKKTNSIIKPDVLRVESRIKKEVKTTLCKKQENNLKQDETKKELPETKQLPETLSYSSNQLLNVDDVDVNDRNNPQLVSVYVKDIYNYLRELETKCKIKDNFLALHATTPRMRATLVNWMVEVAISFGYLLETLHLSVTILDRYLQENKNVGRDTLQLVGATALLIAGKYEEMYWPEVQDIVYVCDDMHTKQEVLEMEREIIKRLNFDFSRPLSIHFLRRYNKIAGVGPEEHALGKYFLELCLLDYNLCHYKPSFQAAAAFCLAKTVLGSGTDPSETWTNTMKYYSSYEYVDFKDILPKLAYTIVKIETSKYQSIRKKYSCPKLCKVSLNSKLKGNLIEKLAEEGQILQKKNAVL